MKKTFFFIPAVLLTAYCGGMACVAGAAAVPTAAWLGLLLLWGSGVLLSRRFIWGAFCGALPGVLMIFHSARQTEQFFHMGLPIGLALLLFYMFCVCAIYRRS